MTFQFRKRIFDLAIAVSSVIILSPLLVLIGILVRVKIGSPILFKQVRPGLHGKPFTIYKFRTMTDERDGNGNLLPDGKQLIRLGRFIRKTSLVLKGFKGEIITIHAAKALIIPILQDAMSFSNMSKRQAERILKTIDDLSWGFEYRKTGLGCKV